MSDELNLLINGRECAERVQAVTWAGSISECARTLDFGLFDPEGAVPCEMGSRVVYRRGGTVLLDGFIFSRGRDMEGAVLDLSCADRGLYLKRNKTAYKFKSTTPEAITRRICGDFGITVGTLAETGVPISRNYPGVSLYAMIATAYSLAAEQTGERYAIRFRGEALEVVAKRKGTETLVIQPGSNLRGGTVTESVESMINQVAIYDDNGVKVGTYRDEEAIGLYGLMQEYLKQIKDKDSAKEAKKLLEDNGVTQKISVTVDPGHPDLIAGNCVVLRESVTGLYGLFWIDADAHTWTKDGGYSTKLTLNFKNIMDEQEAGSLPTA